MGEFLISVIIPCYKQAQYLPEAVASVCAQTYRDWECIIVNDGSPDDTGDVANQLASEDQRIHVIHQANRGLSGARNSGLRLAKGRLIQFLDADDVILSVKLERQLAEISRHSGPSLCYTDYRFGNPVSIMEPDATARHVSPQLDETQPLADLALRWESGLSIPIHCPLFNSELIRGIEFDEGLPNHEDWDFWMRTLHRTPRVVYIPDALAVYRRQPHSMSGDTSGMGRGFLAAIQKQRVIHQQNPAMRKLLRRKAVATRRYYGMSTLWERLQEQAARLKPSRVTAGVARRAAALLTNDD